LPNPIDRLGAFGGAVVMPRDAEHFAARAFEQGVVDHDRDRRSRWEQPINDHVE
jgi:hypothetical protein